MAGYCNPGRNPFAAATPIISLIGDRSSQIALIVPAQRVREYFNRGEFRVYSIPLDRADCFQLPYGGATELA